MLLIALLCAPPSTAEDWLAENLEIHGFVRSRFYIRAPDFGSSPTPSSLRSELNLVTDLQLHSSAEWALSFHAITRPVYEAVFDFQTDLYGHRIEEAAFGTGAAFPDNGVAALSGRGKKFPGSGGRLDGEFTILNADIGSWFSGKLAPSIAIDDVAFFGRVTAPTATRGSQQPNVGGNATGDTYTALRDNFGTFTEPARGLPPGTLFNGGLPAGSGLDASLGLASLTTPLSTPLNAYAGALGDRSSFDDSSFDLNRKENALKFGCFDNAHSTCVFREFYLDFEWRDTFVRLGRQQIVWGKMDFFRLQDAINPVDLSIHNVFPDLDERRIPQLALDVVQTLGKVGPLEDVALEFAWIWDRFLPDQFGQCGEPWAFTVACQARTDAAGHQLLNLSLAAADTPNWTFRNSQPGARIEFRLPKQGISFSFSAFYGFQKQPVTRFQNLYSTANPNAAAMLFLQGIADADFEDPATSPLPIPIPNGSVALVIDELSQLSQLFAPPFAHSGGGGAGVWVTGFDPYDRTGPTPNSGGTLEAANQDLQNAWYLATDPDLGACAGVPDEPGGLSDCGTLVSNLGLPWAGSEAVLEYPRIWSVGGSLDYEIPVIKTVMRLEMAGELNRLIQNTRRANGVSRSSVFKAAIGLDRAILMPFLNPERKALVSVQTFLEHIVDYQGRRVGGDGMVPYENGVISTLYVQNFWRKDSLVLTNLAAVDWNAGAVVWGPKLAWTWAQRVTFEFGVNLLWGQTQRHNLRDLCPDGTLLGSASGCSFTDPTSWQAGNWQLLNAPLERTTRSPFGFARESFADGFMRRRDEFWFGVTYRF